MNALNTALQHHHAGQFEQAQYIYTQLLRADPRNAEALHLLGILTLQQGHAARATEYIARAIEIAPEFPTYHFNLGMALRRAGQLDAAAEAYRASLRLQPHNVDALNNLGAVLIAQENYSDAVDVLQRAQTLCADDVDVRVNLLDALLGLGVQRQEREQFDAAAAVYAHVLALEPGHTIALNNLGAIAQTMGDYARAAQAYRAALETDSEFAEAHKNLASVLHLLDDTEGARAHYQAALRIAPDFVDARYELDALCGVTHAAPPPRYVSGLFDGYASEYDAHMTGVLGYAVPQQLRARLEPYLRSTQLDILDLGCGTGLSGATFADVARTLVGIDVSEKMLEKARDRGVYSQLGVGDVVERCALLQQGFDVVIAADVFVYLGDLAPVFTQTYRVLMPAGLFAFSVERGTTADYTLRSAGRYAHSRHYIQQLAQRLGFRELDCHACVLRQDFGRDVLGHLFILQRPE